MALCGHSNYLDLFVCGLGAACVGTWEMRVGLSDYHYKIETWMWTCVVCQWRCPMSVCVCVCALMQLAHSLHTLVVVEGNFPTI